MISIKKYLEQSGHESNGAGKARKSDLLSVAIAAYRSALQEMGSAGADACSVLGAELKQGLDKASDGLSSQVNRQKMEAAEQSVQAQLRQWGGRTARHYQQKTDEVKELLIAMARAAESVGERDERCASQIADVTRRLRKIATLDDLSQIRASIEASAAELKTSIDRMTAEGRAAVEQLQGEVSRYQVKLEEAEHIASSDSLTGLRNRLWLESHIERRMSGRRPFCIVMVDIDDFKRVNDELGHAVGDELLQRFSTELKSACRSTDIVGRWGGDEFIIVLDCGLAEARTQTVRMKEWVCGSYTVEGRTGPEKLNVDASIGVAERMESERMKELLARADADMYGQKTASRSRR
jgi:diguanylate cyclase (GGDEF)-like protein